MRTSRQRSLLGLVLTAVPALLLPSTAVAATPVPAVAAVEAEALALPGSAGMTFGDDAASGRAGLLMWSDSTASGTVGSSGPASRLVVRARGDQCNGAPQMRVLVDGVLAGTVTVAATSWTDFAVPGAWSAGVHRLQVTYPNDYGAPGCDRNLSLDRVQLLSSSSTSLQPVTSPVPVATSSPAPAPSAAPTPAPAVSTRPVQQGPDVPAVLEAEALALPGAAGMAFGDDAASGRAGLLIWSDGTAGGTLTASGPATGLVVRARGDQCNGAPLMRVLLDGVLQGAVAVPMTGWTDYTLPANVSPGAHRLEVVFPNDYGTPGCDRNLRLDRVQLTGTAPVPSTPAPTTAPVPAAAPVAAPAGNPFLDAQDYRDPSSAAGRAADARRTWDPQGAAALDKIAQGGGADWYGDWNPTSSLAATVSGRIATETAAGALPVVVAYNIPHRDCGSYSAGGAPTGDAYRQWVAALATGIGSRKAVVVLEPDALPQMDCLGPADQTERTSLLSAAAGVLGALPATTVYLDAGGATWQPASVMATRLKAAGIDRVRGFSLNVSGFNASAQNLAYGDEVSRLVGGGKHFVLDTSRNGLGAGDTWCNPSGRALGVRMTTATGDALADAFTWIKTPGESDGTCGGGPSAGQFWVDYAIGLGQRTTY